MKKRILLLITSIIFTLLVASCGAKASGANVSSAKLGKSINNYIDNNPGLLNEMISSAKKQVKDEQSGKKNTAVKTISKNEAALDKKIYSYLISKPELLDKMFKQYKAIKTGKQKAPSKTVYTGIDKSIHNYLITNAKTVLTGMSQAVQAKFVATKQKTLAKQYLTEIKNDKTTPTEGNPKATTTLVEYFDYQCSACKAEWPQIKTAIQTNKDLKVVFAEFPFFKGSEYAAKVSIAGYALDHTKFVKLHSGLMGLKIDENQLTPKDVMQVANTAGYSKVEISNYIKNNAKEINAQIATNRKWFNELRFNGTPSIIIANSANNKILVIPGAPRYLQKAIAQVNNNSANT